MKPAECGKSSWQRGLAPFAAERPEGCFAQAVPVPFDARAPFGFTAPPLNSYNPTMSDSASDETPPIFPRFLAGGPEQLRLGPASAALLIGYGGLVQAASSGFFGWSAQDGWLTQIGATAAAIGGALLIAMLATRWLGRPLGLAAGLLQLTSVYAFGFSAEPRLVGSFVTLLVTAAMGIFARANVPGRLAVDSRLRMQGLFYGCAAGLLLVRRGWGELACILLACLIYVPLNQDGRGFRFLMHPLGLGVAVAFASYAQWLQHSMFPATLSDTVQFLASDPSAASLTPVTEWPWPATLTVGMLPWWPFCVVAVVAGCRRGDYASAFWRFVACWSLPPIALAALGLLGHRALLATTCGPISILSAAGLYESIRWWRVKRRTNS